MLLPSAMACDSSHFQIPGRVAPPPTSPHHYTTTSSSSSHTAVDNLFAACRSLQALLNIPVAPAHANVPMLQPSAMPSRPRQMPTPPLAHTSLPVPTPSSSSHPSSHARPASSLRAAAHPSKIVKRTAASSSSSSSSHTNKSRRSVLQSDDAKRSTTRDALDLSSKKLSPWSAPRTPVRSRIAPEIMPLGLERADFHRLVSEDSGANYTLSSEEPGKPCDTIDDDDTDDAWTTEDDRILVELVLEKLKLTKLDWHDCARTLGRSHACLNKRWKNLMSNGDVGLKTTSQRSRMRD